MKNLESKYYNIGENGVLDIVIDDSKNIIFIEYNEMTIVHALQDFCYASIKKEGK